MLSLFSFLEDDSVFLTFVDDILFTGFSPMQGFVSRTGVSISDFFKEVFQQKTSILHVSTAPSLTSRRRSRL